MGGGCEYGSGGFAGGRDRLTLLQVRDAPMLRRAMAEGYPCGESRGSIELELCPSMPIWLLGGEEKESFSEEAEQMGRHFVSSDVLCPFYKAEDKTKIYCEGVVENSSIHNAFSGGAEPYKRSYCCKNWQSCLISRMLESKYE